MIKEMSSRDIVCVSEITYVTTIYLYIAINKMLLKKIYYSPYV